MRSLHPARKRACSTGVVIAGMRFVHASAEQNTDELTLNEKLGARIVYRAK